MTVDDTRSRWEELRHELDNLVDKNPSILDLLEVVKSSETLKIEKEFSIEEKDKLIKDLEEYNRKTRDFLLNLKSNWDGEKGIPFRKNFVDKTLKYVLEMCIEIWELGKSDFKAPSILPVNDGSIDIEWSGKYEILINIRDAKEQNLTLYAESNKNEFEMLGNKEVVKKGLSFWISMN